MPSYSAHKIALACAAFLNAAMIVDVALAQTQMPGGAPSAAASGASSPMCQRLVGQLASIDNGAAGGDAGKAEQIRRYEDSQTRQQAELDRVQQQAKSQGCESSGFFSIFGGGSSSEKCGPINTRIQQMRGNLDQINSSLSTLRGGSFGNSERDGQRRSVLTALAQNNCGPQYANAARGNSGGGFFDNLFGGNLNPSGDNGAAAGTYRTVCARTCDGFYFPISFATVPSRFVDDEKTCKSLCPNAEATLFSYRNPGEDMNQAVSLGGQQYSASPNAFKYRQAFDKACSCRGAGQTWSEALKNIDNKDAISQGDIIVTDESSKKMAQPPKAVQKKGATPAATPATATPAAPTATDTNAGTPPSGDRPIRSVGPTFIPAR